MYVPLIGWAIFAATLAWGTIDFLAKRYPFRLLPSPWAQIAMTLPLVLALGYKVETEKEQALPRFQQSQALTWSVIQQFQAQKPVFAHNSNVIFLNDPFEAWDMIFIAKLYSRDPSVRFILARLELPHASEGEIAAFDYVFDYRDDKLVRIDTSRRHCEIHPQRLECATSRADARQRVGPEQSVAVQGFSL